MIPSALSPYPSADLAPAEKLEALRQALQKNQLEDAEREWLHLIRGLSGHSEAEKKAKTAAYESYSALLHQMGRETEAERMLARARVIRDGATPQPVKMQRRESTYSFMKEIREEEGLDSSKIEEVKRRVDEQIEAGERRIKALKIVGYTVAGIVGGPIFGLNGLVTGALGLGVGGAMQAKWRFSRH